MPKPPDFLTKVNFIIDYFANPCDAPLIVYAETFLPAIGNTILTLLDFGFDDIVRGALRPRGLRSAPHGRIGAKAGRRGVEIPEVGELIGKQIPGAEIAKGRVITDGAKKLWILDGLAQRALYNLMLVDVTVDFFYNWHSAIIREACGDRIGFGSAYRKTLNNNGFFFLGGFHPVPTPIIVYQRGTATISESGGASNNGRPFKSTLAISVRTLDGSPFNLTIIAKKGNFIIGSAQGSAHTPGQHVEIVMSNTSNTGHGIQYFGFNDKLTWGQADLQVTGY